MCSKSAQNAGTDVAVDTSVYIDYHPTIMLPLDSASKNGLVVIS